MELENQVALVTGAGSGIGAATALRLAEEGADVVLVSRTAEEIDKVAASIEGLGRKALAVAADVADDKAMTNLFRRIGRRFGRLDFVLANAGINGVWAPIEELKPAEWDETIRINLRGTYLTVHHAGTPTKAGNGPPTSWDRGAFRPFLPTLARFVSTVLTGSGNFGDRLVAPARQIILTYGNLRAISLNWSSCRDCYPLPPPLRPPLRAGPRPARAGRRTPARRPCPRCQRSACWSSRTTPSRATRWRRCSNPGAAASRRRWTRRRRWRCSPTAPRRRRR